MANRQFTLTESELKAFRQAETQARDTRTLKRLQAVRMYGSGYSVVEIGTLTGCSWRSLMDWCSIYHASGLDGLKSRWHGNNALKVSRQQRADLKQRLQNHRPDQVIAPELRSSSEQGWTISDLKIVVKMWYGVTYKSNASYLALLHECGFTQPPVRRQFRFR
jgi:transposase